MHSRWFGAVIVVAIFVVSAVLVLFLPGQAAVPWGPFAPRSGTGLRVAIALVLPAVAAVVWGAASLFPHIDPRGARYPEFLDTYWLIMNAGVLFIAVAQGLVLASAFGAPVAVDRYTGLGAGTLIVVIGNYLSRLRPNWFIGIRTPWTLSSETVWRRTHRFAGRLLVAGGVVVAAVSLLSHVRLGRTISVMAAVVSVLTLTESYALWRREQAAR